MLYKRSLLFVLSTILSVILVACGGSADGDGSGDGAESVDLSQSLSYEDEMGATVTISYPEGWVSSAENGSAAFATSEEVLDMATGADLPAVESGQVVAIMLALPSEMVSFFVEEGEDVSPTAIANSFVGDMASDTATIGDVEEATLNGKSAAVVTGSEDGTDLVLVAIDLGDGNYAIIFGATAEGEAGEIRPTIEGMAGSIEYAAAGGE